MSQIQDTTSGGSVNPARQSRLASKKKYRDANKEKIRAANGAYRQANREADIARKKVYREANDERIRAYNTEYQCRKYGISLSRYREMMAECGGRCSCCRIAFSTMFNETACIDHCHSTGAVRGLVCRRCNFIMGNADDNAKILRACIRYLERAKRERAG